MADLLNYIGLVLIILSVICTGVSSYLNSQKAKAQAVEIAKLKNDNLELSAAAAPRIIDQGTLSQALANISGINYEIIVVPDFESRKAAAQLRTALDMAKWKFISSTVTDDTIGLSLFDGITVENNVGAIPNGDNSKEAAQNLVYGLNAQKIQAKTFPAVSQLPPNTILIKVGLKPVTYFINNTSGNIKANETY